MSSVHCMMLVIKILVIMDPKKLYKISCFPVLHMFWFRLGLNTFTQSFMIISTTSIRYPLQSLILNIFNNIGTFPSFFLDWLKNFHLIHSISFPSQLMIRPNRLLDRLPYYHYYILQDNPTVQPDSIPILLYH